MKEKLGGANYNNISIVWVGLVMQWTMFEIRLGAWLAWIEQWDDSNKFMRTKTKLRQRDTHQEFFLVFLPVAY